MKDNQNSVFEAFARDVGRKVGEEWRALKKDFSEAAQETRELGAEGLQMAKDAAGAVNRVAGKAAVKAEEIYEDFDVNDRLYGMGVGMKAGAIAGGLRAGSHGAGVGVVVGGVVGFAIGHKGVEKFRQWRDGHKPANDVVPAPTKKDSGPDISP